MVTGESLAVTRVFPSTQPLPLSTNLRNAALEDQGQAINQRLQLRVVESKCEDHCVPLGSCCAQASETIATKAICCDDSEQASGKQHNSQFHESTSHGPRSVARWSESDSRPYPLR